MSSPLKPIVALLGFMPEHRLKLHLENLVCALKAKLFANTFTLWLALRELRKEKRPWCGAFVLIGLDSAGACHSRVHGAISGSLLPRSR